MPRSDSNSITANGLDNCLIALRAWRQSLDLEVGGCLLAGDGFNDAHGPVTGRTVQSRHERVYPFPLRGASAGYVCRQCLAELIDTDWQHTDARRLIKRLRRHQNDLLTFLDHPGVPFDNNHAERAIRPAVIMRKTSYTNRSDRGADTQAVLMSIYRTLKQRGHHPIQTIVKALETYLKTSHLPPLPPKTTADV